MTNFLFCTLLAVGYLTGAAVATKEEGVLWKPGKTSSSPRKLQNGNAGQAPLGFRPAGHDLVGHSPSGDDRDTLFGHTMALSANGGRLLAVGAPGHDYAEDGSLNQGGGAIFLYDFNGTNWNQFGFLQGSFQEGLGEYFSVDANGTRIAARRSLVNSNANWVEVYNITNNGTMVQVGMNLTCGDVNGRGGETVTISSDGNRIAVSCEYTGTGQVRIYDFDDGNWQPRVDLDGDANGGRFGRRTKFSADGNRIAVADPNQNSDDDINNIGMVRVFDYLNDTHWLPTGEDIMGAVEDDRLGTSMDLSGDGSTVAVACPWNDGSDGTSNVGLVKVFSYSQQGSYGNWSQVGDAIEGENRNDRFGRAISLSDDGRRLASSSYFFDAFRGQVRLFDYDPLSNVWIQYGENIEGENTRDRFAYGLYGVSLTGDGTRLASGSTLYDDRDTGLSTGRVRVFDMAPRQQQQALSIFPNTTDPTQASTTQSPTVLPTEHTEEPTTAPTGGPTFFLSPTSPPSQAPATASPTSHPTLPPTKTASSTGAPTTAPPTDGVRQTPSPTVALPNPPMDALTTKPNLSTPIEAAGYNATQYTQLGKFDWDLKRLGKIDINFDEQFLHEEIIMYYNIHHRTSRVTVLQDDCKEEVNSTYVVVRTNTIPYYPTNIMPYYPTHDNLEVHLDLVQGELVGSPIYEQVDIDTGLIAICLRVELLMDDPKSTSVVFHEQKMNITLSMTDGFSVINVSELDLDREEADSASADVGVTYNVTACQCNRTSPHVCTSETLTQGSEAHLCIRTYATDVHIAEIRGLQMIQENGITRNNIIDGEPDGLTEITYNAGGDEQLAVIRTLLPSGFFESADNIAVTGSCALSFSDDTSASSDDATTSSRVVRTLRSVPFEHDRNLQESSVADFDLELTIESPLDESSAIASSVLILALLTFGAVMVLAFAM